MVVEGPRDWIHEVPVDLHSASGADELEGEFLWVFCQAVGLERPLSLERHSALQTEHDVLCVVLQHMDFQRRNTWEIPLTGHASLKKFSTTYSTEAKAQWV